MEEGCLTEACYTQVQCLDRDARRRANGEFADSSNVGRESCNDLEQPALGFAEPSVNYHIDSGITDVLSDEVPNQAMRLNLAIANARGSCYVVNAGIHGPHYGRYVQAPTAVGQSSGARLFRRRRWWLYRSCK